MKIAVSGKGGAGKSTIAGILAHLFGRQGFRVLAVDADPDANFASAIGIPHEQVSLLVPISAQCDLVRERTGATPRQFGQLFKMNPRVEDIPDKYCLDFRGIRVLVMGAVRKGGSGCACPENVLLKSLLQEIILNRDEVVIIDMEAGIEHLGRGTAQGIDKMLIIVEPSLNSVRTARTIMKLGREIGMTGFGIIGNKVRDEAQRQWIGSQFPQDLVLGMIPYSEIIRDADMKGAPLIDLLDETLKAEFETIFRALKPNP